MDSGGRNRIGKLDSVRGIAALMVVIGHCHGISLFGLEARPFFWWLPVLWDGESAVIMFFILSGYVLALQLEGPKSPTLTQYLVCRFLRIWPPFAMVVLLSFGVLIWTQTPVDAGAHVGPPTIPSLRDLAENLLMIGNPYAIDPPVWSLYVEMRLSLMFPLIFWLSRRFKFLQAMTIALVVSVLLCRAVRWSMPGLLSSLAEAIHFVVLFVAGAALSRPDNPVKLLYERLHPAAKAAWLLLAFGCLGYRFLPEARPLPFGDQVRWLGVGLLFIVCLYSTVAERLLSHRPLHFLGRVSYGVYLAHFPLMLLIAGGQHATWKTLLIVAASLAMGTVINIWVEQPMARLARKIPANWHFRTGKWQGT